MTNVGQLLGLDRNDPDQARASHLVRADREFLRRLVKIREDSGLTQKDVADRLGIQQPSVAAFERYDNDPKMSTVRKYAHAIEALVAHRAEPDTGQLLDDTTKAAWVGGWKPSGVGATSQHNVVVTVGMRRFAVDSSQLEFALAS